jgi:hypothetical protein
LKAQFPQARRFFLPPVFFLALFVCAPVRAVLQELPLEERAFPDSSLVRAKLEAWLTQPLSEVRGMRNEIHTSESGQVFQVRMEELESSFNIIVAPRQEMIVDVYSDDGVYSELTYAYVSNSPGAWALSRDSATGKPLAITYYFLPDSNVFARVTPGEQKCYVDLVIFDSYIVRRVEMGIPFERLYSASLGDLRAWTPSIPWYYVARRSANYEDTRQMIEVIRKNQKRFVFAPDAAYNELGESVEILTGERRVLEQSAAASNKLEFSDAGFLKWIIDGLAHQYTQQGISVSSLTKQTVNYKTGSFQGVLATRYNLSFALDWTRNLAAAMLSVKKGKTYVALNSGVDVALEPFALSPHTTYTPHSGYPAQGLLPLLYVLAVTEPDVFYLAAIRQTDYVSPEVHFFSRCAAIFPYIDSAGRFRASVFENGNELSLSQFIEKYKKDSIHLTRVQASMRFLPQ